ncbi:hypothetical protein ACROYT_G033169 [Oculina patagonica]
MTASSFYNLEDDFGHPYYGRLHGSRGQGWCASTGDSIDDWLQVDLGKAFTVCGVATQGAVSASSWVTDFKLNYSSDGNIWTTYKYENENEVEFHREGENTIVDRHKLPVPVSARYIRFNPTKQEDWNCLRVEVYSINITAADNCASSPCRNSGNCSSFPGGYNCTCPPEFFGDNCEIVCSAKMNLAFAVDGSNKMGDANFDNIVNFVFNVSSNFDVAVNKTWIVTVFGNQTNVYKTKEELDNSTAPSFPNSTQVLLGKTLESVKERLSNNDTQRGAVNVVVLITTHRSDDDIAIPTIQLKTSNATVFAVGIGDQFSLGQLKEIASDPDDHHFSKATDTTDLLKNLATPLAKKICQVADRCASSPCRNNGKCTSFPDGYNCTCSLEFYGDNCEISKSVPEYISLGCFNDSNVTPAIPSLESENATYLDGNFTTRSNPMEKCALEAAKMGYKVFALQDGGACHSGPYAHLNYSIYGPGTCAPDGLGGVLGKDVYLLGAKCGNLLSESLIHLSSETIHGSSFNESWGIPLLDGNYSWCPTDSDSKRTLEIESGREVFLTKLTVQGKKGSKDYADNFCFASSVDGGGVQEIIRTFSTCLINLSNQSSNGKTEVTVTPALTAQYLNFAPWRPFKGDGMCLRIDVFRSFNASTHISILREAGNTVTYNYTSVRGNLTGPPLVDGNLSWCPLPDDNELRSEPVLKVDLGMPFNITKVQVQGAKDASEWPYKFCLSYSLNGSHFSEVKTQESSCLLFGQTNDDLNDIPRPYDFSPPRLVQSVSLQPKYPTLATNEGYCIRTDLEGCVTTTVDREQVIDGCSHRTKRGKCCVLPFLYKGEMIYSCIKDNHNQPWCATTDDFDRDKLWDNCQESTSRPCHAMSCLNGGTCVEDVMEWSFKCICSEKFVGERCEDDFDECHNSLCQNGATCVNTHGDYRCECKHGYSGKNCNLDCKFSEIELGFLLDGSASVEFYGQGNFQLIKDSTKSFIRSFNVSSGAIRVGVIVYSTNSTVAFTLNQFASEMDIEEAIDNITYPGGETFTGQALNDAARVLFSNDTVRANVSKILVVIIDGVSTDDVTQPAALVNETGVTTYVIGIGQNYDRSQLLQIALDVEAHVIEAEFNDIQEAFGGVRETICRELDKCADNPCRFGGICKNEGLNCTCAKVFQGPECSEDVKECSNASVNCTSGKHCTETFGGHECTCANMTLYGENCTKDCRNDSTVLFLLDRARNVGQDNIKRQVEFIISVASTIHFKNIAVISYATDAEIVIRPGQASNFTEFAETLRQANYSMGHMKNLGEALEKVQEIPEIFNHTTPALVVAMILGKSDDDNGPHAAELKRRGVTIVAMTLDSSYSLAQLTLLTSNPLNDHWLTTEAASLKDFISITRNTICKAWDPCGSAVCPSPQICRNNYGLAGGSRCVPPPSVCEPNPCLNGGNCINVGNSTFNCTCPAGIGGQNCTEDIKNECSSSPCQNGGQCRDLLGSFECVCPEQYSGKQCDVVCSAQRFNLVFLVDGSGSIEHQGRGNFQRSKDFVIALLRTFEIGRDEVNVATVLYWHSYRIIHNLNTYYSKENIIRAIQAMRYPAGGTRTGRGLNAIRTQIFNNLGASRSQLPKVVVVVTDGLSQDNVVQPAQALRNMGVTIIAVGVGCCFYRPELNAMASDPDADHVFEVSFRDLDKITGSLREQICFAIDFCAARPCENGGNCTSLAGDFQCSCTSGWTGKNCSVDIDECATNITQCPDNQVCHNYPGGSTCLCTDNRYGNNCTLRCNHTKVDVGFLVDSSGSINIADRNNYQRIKDFIKGFIKSIVIGENDTRIGLATYSGPTQFRVRFNFTELSTTNSLVNAVQMIPYDAGGTLTGDALNRIRTELFSMARDGLPKVLVVLTVGKSQDSVTVPSHRLRDMDVHIISVGVGGAVYSELADMASEPDSENIFNVTFASLGDLIGSLLDSVCKAADPCHPQPCKNGGICHVMEETFRCECPPGLMGPTCEIDIDECFNNPCINDAVSCKNTFGSYECNCRQGFTGIHCQTGILSNVFDVAFLCDGSSFITYSNFRRTLLFAKTVLSFFNISREQTNVAAAVYASDVVVSFNFTEHYNLSAVSTAIDGIPYLNQTSLNISSALETVNNTLFTTGRENVTRVLVVFVSEMLSGNFTKIAQDLRDQGVVIIAVGVGSGFGVGHGFGFGSGFSVGSSFSVDQLKAIASKPSAGHVFITSFVHIDTAEGVIGGAIVEAVDPCASFPCRNGGNCTSTTNNYTCACPNGFNGTDCQEDANECQSAVPPTCDDPKICINTRGGFQCVCEGTLYGTECQHSISAKLEIDLAFLLDGSQVVTQDTFTHFLSFVKAVTASLNVSEEETHIAVAVYGNNPKTVIDFDDHYNQSSLESAVDAITYPDSRLSNMGAGLSIVASRLFNSNAARPNAMRVLVVLTATKSQDDIEIPSHTLLTDANKVQILSIGVRTEYSLGQLREISSDPDSSSVVTYASGKNLAFATSSFKVTLAAVLAPCSSSPCINDGTCMEHAGSYFCICPAAYFGSNCDKVSDPCTPNPCKNTGACQILPLNAYHCTCSSGWTGTNCDQDIQECSRPDDVCQQHGVCVEEPGDYRCKCNSGYAGKNCDKSCTEKKIDLAFMIEGSSSLNQWGENNFEKTVNAVQNVVKYFNDSQSNIGIVLYATEAKVKANFSFTPAQTNNVLDNLVHPSGWTRIGKGLNFTRDQLFMNSRENAHRVLVVFTDGTSIDSVFAASELLRDMKVTIITVALGDWYDINQVKGIASDPDSKTTLLTGFDELGGLTWRLREMICEAVDHCFSNPCRFNRPCINLLDTYQCDCGSNFTGQNCEEVVFHCGLASNPCSPEEICLSGIGSAACVCAANRFGQNCAKVGNNNIDLVFLVDGSSDVTYDNFWASIPFFEKLANALVDSLDTQVALVIYAEEPHTIFGLNRTFPGAHADLQFPDKPQRNVGRALIHIKDTVIATGGRTGVPKLVINVQNRKSDDGIDVISQQLRADGTKVINIGSGDQIAIGQLKEMAFEPSDIYVKNVGYDAIDSAGFVLQVKASIFSAVNPCSSLPCLNGGVCNLQGDGFTCTCAVGYTGDTCESMLSLCVPNPCQNRGTCTPGASGSTFTCECGPGFTSPNCEDDVNECDSEPCQNEGQCVNTHGGYHCVCPQGSLGTNCELVCTRQVFNLAFLIDGSATVKSLSSEDKAHYKGLVKSVIGFYNVSRDAANVGVVVYSSNATTEFRFDEYYSKSDVNSAIDSIVFPGKFTRAGTGLTAVRNELFANGRSGIPNFLVVVMDGVAIDDISLPSALLRAMNVYVLAVGVGDFYAKPQLEEIANDPDSAYVFEEQLYGMLPTTATRVKKSICNVVDHCFNSPCYNGATCESLLDRFVCTCPAGFTGNTCATDIDECSPTSPCTDVDKICINFPGTHFCNCKPGNFEIQNSCDGVYSTIFNIAYVIYTGESIDRYRKGNFAKQIEFAKGLSKTFNVDRSDTNVGIITYSGDAAVRYRFENITNQADLESALDSLTISGNGRNIGEALHLARTDLFNQSNEGRNVTRNILVVITDGGSDDDLAVPTYALKEDGVTIFSVGIDRYVRGQLNEMASDPDSEHVFTIDFYDGLGLTMAPLKDAIIQDVDPCANKPCANNATCLNLPGGGFRCTCTPGWTGERCDIQLTPCTVSPHPCNNNGYCTANEEDESVECKCFEGWQGKNCENDKNECLQNPCLNGGNCTNTNGSYYCQCPLTFAGDNCEMHCDHHNMNLGFMVDGSATVDLLGKGNFNKSLEFVANLIGSFDVSENATSPGMVVFSEDPRLIFNFSKHKNSADAMAAVKMAPYPSLGRKTGKALNFVRRDLFTKSATQNSKNNYLIILASGVSYDLVKTPAMLLREKNVTIFIIGVGRDYDVNELKLITGVNGSRVYTTSFKDLGDLNKKLKKDICVLQELNKCSPSPCLNGGLCINTGQNYRCVCPLNYYGKRCQLGCGLTELGLKTPNTRRVPDKYISASSQRDSSHAAHRGRIGIEVIGTWEDGWCSSQTDTAPYFQVFFEYLTNITAIETEGVEDGTTNLWVQSYYVSTSNSTDETSFVEYTEKGKRKIFTANTGLLPSNVTLHGTNAHFIRIHPLNHTGQFACLRVALYGCDNGEGFMELPSSLLERISNAPNVKTPVFDTRLAAIPVAVFVFLLVSSLLFLMLPLGNPSPMAPSQTETLVRIDPDAPQTGALPMVPMYEVQSVSMQLGSENAIQVENVNTSSNDAIFSNDNKIFSFDRQTSPASEGYANLLETS